MREKKESPYIYAANGSLVNPIFGRTTTDERVWIDLSKAAYWRGYPGQFPRPVKLSGRLIGVYFIQTEHGGPVKIGVSRRIGSRVSDIQSTCPYQIVQLAAVHMVDARYERWLHRRFSKDRLHGEWFKASNDLVAFIQEKKWRTGEIVQEEINGARVV